jgi:hypothetical protein
MIDRFEVEGEPGPVGYPDHARRIHGDFRLDDLPIPIPPARRYILSADVARPRASWKRQIEEVVANSRESWSFLSQRHKVQEPGSAGPNFSCLWAQPFNLEYAVSHSNYEIDRVSIRGSLWRIDQPR